VKTPGVPVTTLALGGRWLAETPACFQP